MPTPVAGQRITIVRPLGMRFASVVGLPARDPEVVAVVPPWGTTTPAEETYGGEEPAPR
jgi:hypothetical protein